MKISKLIADLELIKANHGDLQVYVTEEDSDFPSDKDEFLDFLMSEDDEEDFEIESDGIKTFKERNLSIEKIDLDNKKIKGLVINVH